jgi:hypothetical protein
MQQGMTNEHEPMPYMWSVKQLRYGDRKINWSKARALLVRICGVPKGTPSPVT